MHGNNIFVQKQTARSYCSAQPKPSPLVKVVHYSGTRRAFPQAAIQFVFFPLQSLLFNLLVNLKQICAVLACLIDEKSFPQAIFLHLPK